MSIRLALLAFIVSLWGCGGHSMPTAPKEAVLQPTGKLKSSDTSPVGSVRSKPAVINAGSSVDTRDQGTNQPPIFNISTEGRELTLLLPNGPHSSTEV